MTIKWASVTAIASGVLALATIFAVRFAYVQIEDVAQARKAQDYLELRKTFLEVDAALDIVDRKKTYSEASGCPQWHALKRYWYFSETEWKVAQIDDAQRKNWENTQLPQVANALRRAPYRQSFIDMRKMPANRLGDSDGIAFVKAVMEKYEELRKDDKTLKPLTDTSDLVPATSCTGSLGSVYWYRNSAEMKATYSEIFAQATKAVESEAQKLRGQSWGVIMDVDETILDNSEYQKKLALGGSEYTRSSFLEWIREQKTVLLPGAQDFVRTVNQIQGKVILVTDQTPDQCKVTETRLHALDVKYDRILCDNEGTGNKNGRFTEVQNGDKQDHAPPIKIVAWVGDNIHDFPDLDQQKSDTKLFGSTYFVLPNPMYGSWEKPAVKQELAVSN